MLDHVPEAERAPVVEAMEQTLEAWLGYRDGVAEAVGLVRGPSGAPRLSS
jgi:hypothetical protein